MLYFARGAQHARMSSDDLKQGLCEALGALGPRRKVLVLPPGVNISSMNAFRPLTRIPAYSAAKAAGSNFTQWLAVHLSKAGIRGNAIAPGFFLTDQNRARLTQPDGALTARVGGAWRTAQVGKAEKDDG